MQKYGTVNKVCVTKQAAEPVAAKLGLARTERVVDGCEVYEGGEGPGA